MLFCKGWLPRALFLSFGANMRAIFGLFGFLLTISLVACDSEITDVVTYPSPDGKFVLAVVTELQAANDPTPWWTHVSLRQPGDNLRKIPGNVLKLEGRGQTTAQWQGPSRVVLTLRGELKDLNKIPTEKTIRDVTVVFVTNQGEQKR